MRSRLLALLSLLIFTQPAPAAGGLEAEQLGADRLSRSVIKAAKAAYPLAILTVQKLSKQDGSLLYLFTLDARSVAGAPEPVLQSLIIVAPNAPMHAVHQALREASTEVGALLRDARKRQNLPQLRPDLLDPEP